MQKQTNRYTNVVPNLYKAPDGYYHARRKIKGRYVQTALGTKDARVARQLCAEWMAATAANPPPKNFRITLCEAIELTLAEIRKKKPRSCKVNCSYAQMIYQACRWEGGPEILFSELTVEHCLTIFDRTVGKDGVQRVGLICRDNRKPAIFGKPVSAGTYNNCLGLMHRVCRDRRHEGYCLDDPMERARIRRLPQSKFARETPTLNQARMIVAHVRRHNTPRSEESADFIETTYEDGLGTADIAGLTWGAVNREAGVIKIIRIKTDRAVNVPLFKWPQSRWNRLVERATARNHGKPPGPDVKVFNIKSPAKALKTACKALGLPDFNMRDLRRLFIYMCRGGVSAKQVADSQELVDQGDLSKGADDREG